VTVAATGCENKSMRSVALSFRFAEKAAPYAAALRLVGLEPAPITPERPASLSGVRGLVLTGGTDVDPALYGQEAHAATDKPDRERDELEAALLREALEQDLPILAICRGMQLFNVVFGGTLIQHLDGHAFRTPDPSEPAHQVRVEPCTRLCTIVGEGLHAVNSRHHQAIDRLGNGLVPAAYSVPDGIIEAFEVPRKRFALAVQWHPEDQVSRDATQRKLFEAFGDRV